MWPFKRRSKQVLKVDYQSARRVLGEGYEPHVYQQDGKLIYEFPVDWSFTSTVRSFEIQKVDLVVLLQDSHRRAVLEVVSHILAQRAIGRGEKKFTQKDFDRLISQTLHSSDRELQNFTVRISRNHNTAVQHFVDAVLSRRQATASPD